MAKGAGAGERRVTLQQLDQLRALKREVEVLEYRVKESGDAGIRRRLEKRIRTAAHQEAMLEAYIARIEDSRLRQMFELRFASGMSWLGVARSLGVTEDSVKKAVYRYIRNAK